jgi:Ca2+-binding EF-hand superfamily protein
LINVHLKGGAQGRGIEEEEREDAHAALLKEPASHTTLVLRCVTGHMAGQSANQFVGKLRTALTRVDRNGDGLLNFDEFKSGIKELGVQLPEAELVKIWQEASMEPFQARPAGQTAFQCSLDGNNCQRSAKKLVKKFDETTFQSHLGEAFQVNETALTNCASGVFSHKKVGYKTGNSKTELVFDPTERSLTTKELSKRGHHCNNLELPSHMSGGDPNNNGISNTPAQSLACESMGNSVDVRGTLKFDVTTSPPMNQPQDADKIGRQAIVTRCGQNAMRRALVPSRPPDTPGFLTYIDESCDLTSVRTSMEAPSKDARWTKTEENLRTGLKNSCNLPEFARIQGVLESEIRRIDKNEGGGELSYDELKQTLDRCGFPMVENDFELLWRRVDKDCLGQVITNTLHVFHGTHTHTNTHILTRTYMYAFTNSLIQRYDEVVRVACYRY